MEKRTKLICVAPGLGVIEFMKYNKTGLSVVWSSYHIIDIKSLIGQYDVVIVPYEETIMKEMKKIDMNVLAVIPKVHRYSEILENFIDDMSSGPSKSDIEQWKRNIFIPIDNHMDFITLDTGEFLTNSIDKIMKSPIGYNYPKNWLSTKRFVFDRSDIEAYSQDSNFEGLLLEITEYSGEIICISLDGDGMHLSNEIYVKGMTIEKYYEEMILSKKMSENTIEINSRTLVCPKDENGLIDWNSVRQQLVIQHMLPKYY